jgi:hypothetical protein
MATGRIARSLPSGPGLKCRCTDVSEDLRAIIFRKRLLVEKVRAGSRLKEDGSAHDSVAEAAVQVCLMSFRELEQPCLSASLVLYQT